MRVRVRVRVRFRVSSGCWECVRAPRSMKLDVLRRRMSAFLLEEYSMATWLGFS